MRVSYPNSFLWLLLVLATFPVVGQNRSGSGGTIGIVPGTGATMTPGMTSTPVAPSRGVAVAGRPPAGTGLQAAYYAKAPRGAATYQRVEPGVGVTWRGAAPAPGVPGQGFSVRWTGYVRAPETGIFVLHTEWDDATDISFAGKSVLAMDKMEAGDMERFVRSGPAPSYIPVESLQYFTAGQFYRIDLAYKNVRGVSRAVLAWARPSELGHPANIEQAFAVAKGHRYKLIPQEFLYPELPRPPAQAVAVARVPAATTRPAAPRRTATQPATPRRTVPAQPAVPSATPLPLPALATLPSGTVVALTSLYFTQSTADLLPASRPTLNALTQELRQHQALRLEIAGHTDNVGEADKNLRLSLQRARVVRRYLVQQGIDSLRLVARGYGGTRPVADNRDPQQRPRNRRVEVVVQ